MLFVLSVFIFLTDCSSSKKNQAVSSRNESFTAANDSANFVKLNLTAEQSAGMKIFLSHCNKCHPGGKEGKGPSLIEKKPSKTTIHWQVRLGFGPMPHFGKNEISKEELKQIISFVKLIEEKQN